MRRCVKSQLTLALAGILTVGGALKAECYAGQWQQDNVGWWYQNDNGGYVANGWKWIDGNGDGISECYYFTPSGYCLLNATTPDGYTVNLHAPSR